MSFTLELVLRRSERALERALGLAGRRGYEVVGITAAAIEDGRRFAVRLTLESDRRAEALIHQLAKLVEVDSVRLADAPSESTDTPVLPRR